ncbi:MAG: LacI family DNA-binding transcriptional regulator [Silicimonas sp.]|nr:LacI family DNA-binding transcriptional regulator [Silicimonas sp.]
MNLREFSQHLGLSPTTVSRALNGYPEVREATRQRVMEEARRLNYQPDSRARGLATGHGMTIGHVIPAHAQGELVNPIFGDFIAGATSAGAAKGYDISLTIADDDDEARIYRKIKSEGLVAGIVLQGPRMNDRRIGMLNDIGLEFVVHGRASEVAVPYSWVDVNNQRAFHQATRFLTDLGHERIGLINGRLEFDFAHRRRNGYLAALHEVGLPVEDDLQISGDMTEANGYAAAKSMLTIKQPPTAFLAASVMSAIGVRRALHDAGLILGRDVSLITYDDDLSYLSNRESPPFFTAIRSSVRLAGEKVVDVLLRRLGNPSRDHEDVLLEAELIVGTSTGPCRQ